MVATLLHDLAVPPRRVFLECIQYTSINNRWMTTRSCCPGANKLQLQRASAIHFFNRDHLSKLEACQAGLALEMHLILVEEIRAVLKLRREEVVMTQPVA